MRRKNWETFGIKANTLMTIPDWVKEKPNYKIMYLLNSRLGKRVDSNSIQLERDNHCIFLSDKNSVLDMDRYYDLYIFYDGYCGTIELKDYKEVIDGVQYAALVQPGCNQYYYSCKLAKDNADNFMYGYAYYYKYYAIDDHDNYTQMNSSIFINKTHFKDWIIKEFEEDMKIVGPSEVEEEHEWKEVAYNA